MSVKNQKYIQCGRSMVEMLGVLAIMGVLSIGGIAGYSKAMMQYKINKTTDQITQIVSGLRTLYSTQDKYDITCSSTDSCPILKKGHIAPDEMWNGSSWENPFGGGVSVTTSAKKADNDNQAFIVTFAGLPKEACMAIATYDWGSGSSSGLVALGIGDSSTVSGKKKGSCSGSANPAVACPGDSTVPVPMPVNVAAGKCTDGSSISLKFF